MRICQYYRSAAERDADLNRRQPRHARLGAVVEDEVAPLADLENRPITAGGVDLPELLEWTGGVLPATLETTDERLNLSQVFLGPPVLRPRAFLDFYTFEQHVSTCRAKRGLDVVPEWYEFPAYYNANASALYGHGQSVPFPPEEDRLDYELELACIIGTSCRNVLEEEAAGVIAGYTILNDWSARSMQARVMKIGLGPARGKDHGASLGPAVVSRDAVPDVRDLTMRAYVNDDLWSEGNSGSSHFTFEQMIAFASRTRTLFPGDILGSGTVGTGCGLEQDRFLKPGDRVRLVIDGLGELENEIHYESAGSHHGAV